MKSKAIRMERTRTLTLLLRALFSGALPFLLAATRMLGALSPFSTAFTGAADVSMLIPAAIGATAGIFVFRPEHIPLRVVTVLLICALRFLLQRLLKKKSRPLLNALLVFGAGGVSLTFYSLLNHLSTASLFLLILDLVLSASCCALFSAGIAVFGAQGRAAYSEPEQIGVCTLAAAAVAAAAAVTLFHINLGIVLSCVLILLCAAAFGAAGASVCGILCAGALCAASSDLFSFAVMLALAAFFAGAFHGAGRFAQMLVLLCCGVFTLFLFGAPIGFSYYIIAMFLGSAVYVVLPQRFARTLFVPFLTIHAAPEDHSLADRIHLLSETVRSIRGELSQVTDKFNQIDYNNISSVYDSAASSVCKSCDHCLSCWDTRYNEIMDAFGPLDKVLRQNGMVTAEALPRYFKESCRKTDALCRAINTRYRAFLSRESNQRQIRESQQLMFDNLYTIGDTLSALEETLRAPEEEETAMRAAAERAFRKLDEPFTSMDAKRTSGGSLHLTVCTNAEPAHAAGELCVAVSEETGVLFSSAAIFSSGTCCRILFAQDAVYQTENGVQQIARSGNHVCGDSVSTFSDAFGNHCFLLSDGMGSGGRAAIDSLMTCSMLKRLLCAGFGTSAAFRLINGALSVKSADESLSTVDLLQIDPATGQAAFLKAGAAVSLLCRDGRVREIGKESLPLGILQNTERAQETLQLADGDVILMMSDGACAAGMEPLRSALAAHAHRSAREIAFAVCSAIRPQDEKSDDLSVVAIKITKQ